MAGMGPPPKPASQRRRTNPTVAMVQLPLEGYDGDVPDFPLDHPSMRELDRWNVLWRLPVAIMWARQRCELVVARYVRNCLTIEQGGVSVATAHLNAEVRQQEDRLGLSPMALLRLRWEVLPDQIEEQREAHDRGTRRLRAVDPSEAAEG
jgi:hypothetical protein